MPRLMSILLVLALAVGARSESAAVAAEKASDGHAPAHAGGHGGAADGHGKTFDPFGWSTDTFVWSTVVFGLLVGTLWTTAWPKIAKALDERENLIREGVESAERLAKMPPRLRRNSRPGFARLRIRLAKSLMKRAVTGKPFANAWFPTPRRNWLPSETASSGKCVQPPIKPCSKSCTKLRSWPLMSPGRRCASN